MLLESISRFIYILFMRAGCGGGGDDLGLCSKVAAPSVAGGANAENLITSLKKTTSPETEESCRSPQRLNCTSRPPQQPG